MALNPVAAEISGLVVAGRAASTDHSVEAFRAGYVQLFSYLLPTETTCTVAATEVAGLPALAFTPPEADGGLLVWFHGGGWVLGSSALTLSEMDLLCAQARCRGLSVDYRLAPERPFPSPQRDAIAAAGWCVEHAADLGADPRAVAVGGDSAGGNLAAVAAQRVEGLAAQLLVYPGCDNSRDYHAAPHAEGYLLDGFMMDWFLSHAAGGHDLSDPLVSPALAARPVLAGVPPALVITAEFDLLRDVGRDYVDSLRAAGVHVEHAHFEEETHLFFSMPSALEGARVAIALAASFLRSRFDAV